MTSSSRFAARSASVTPNKAGMSCSLSFLRPQHVPTSCPRFAVFLNDPADPNAPLRHVVRTHDKVGDTLYCWEQLNRQSQHGHVEHAVPTVHVRRRLWRPEQDTDAPLVEQLLVAHQLAAELQEVSLSCVSLLPLSLSCRFPCLSLCLCCCFMLQFVQSLLYVSVSVMSYFSRHMSYSLRCRSRPHSIFAWLRVLPASCMVRCRGSWRRRARTLCPSSSLITYVACELMIASRCVC